MILKRTCVINYMSSAINYVTSDDSVATDIDCDTMEPSSKSEEGVNTEGVTDDAAGIIEPLCKLSPEIQLIQIKETSPK